MRLARRTVACLLLLPTLWLASVLPAQAQAPVSPAQPAPRAEVHADPSTTTQAGAPHTAIPFKQEKQSTDTMAYQSLAALVLVGLAAYGIVFGLKRFGRVAGPLGKARRARTVDAIRLGRRSMLYVVEYRGNELLLAESEHGVQLLATTPATVLAHAADQGAADA